MKEVKIIFKRTKRRKMFWKFSKVEGHVFFIDDVVYFFDEGNTT